MFKFRLIVTVVVVSLLFGCGPSELEQTVDEIEAAKQIEITKTIASVEIARVEGTARIEADAAIAIVDRISRAKTEQELIEYAATVALFSQQGQPINSQLNRYDNY